MISVTEIPHPIHSMAELDRWLSQNNYCVAPCDYIPDSIFHDLVSQSHGCIVKFKKGKTAILSRFTVGVCIPFSFVTQHVMPARQTILVETF